MRLVIENIITDLRKNGVNITDEVFNYINQYVDIQNSYINKLNISKWQDLKDKNVLFVDNNDIVAVYGDNRFMYNPNKIKVSSAPSFDIYEVIIDGTDVANRRKQRRLDRDGLVSTKTSDLKNLPRSSQYVYEKDWDPEVNRRYYKKLLQQNNLGKYAIQLDDAYDVVTELIKYRKEETTIGKRTVYNDVINSLVSQIKKIEILIESVDKNFSSDDFDKLGKEMSKLPRLVEKAEYLIKTEKDQIKVFGHPKVRNHMKIEK